MFQKFIFILFFFNTLSASVFCQNVSFETVEFEMLKSPKFTTEKSNRQFKVTVSSPYNLTAEDVMKQSKADHQQALKKHDSTVIASEKEHQQRLKNYDSDVIKAKEKYELESAEFKKLSLLERLSMTDRGQNPKLVLPTKPEYYKPSSPVYTEPNLKDYNIVNNDVLASQINVAGFTRGGSYLDIHLDISKVGFQDNAGQSFANQPTRLKALLNGTEKLNDAFFEEYKFISSVPTNNINKPLEEKNHVNKLMAFINQYLNESFGYQSIKNSVKIEQVKNKGEYDDLEKADIYVKTNLRKLNPQNPDISAVALENMQKGINIWTNTLKQIDYKNGKAPFNAKIAKFVYANLIRLNVALGYKKEAEKYLNEMQENMIYLKLSRDEENELKKLETEIYKTQ